VEVDLMLSADRVLVKIAEKCREDAPFAIAPSRLCKPAEAVEDVLAALSD
jgi:hypothetical protein